MPEIVVVVVDAAAERGMVHRYSSAVYWRIDDHLALHVVGQSGDVGMYAPGCWRSVRIAE